MFNRKDLPTLSNPFGARSDGARPSPQGYANPNQAPPRYDVDNALMSKAELSLDPDVPMTDALFELSGYGTPPSSMGRPPPQQLPGRMPAAGRQASSPTWTLHPTKSPNENYTFGNL